MPDTRLVLQEAVWDRWCDRRVQRSQYSDFQLHRAPLLSSTMHQRACQHRRKRANPFSIAAPITLLAIVEGDAGRCCRQVEVPGCFTKWRIVLGIAELSTS